nr:DUF2142 domain-containing protein [Thermoleophilaceae bacterium]
PGGAPREVVFDVEPLAKDARVRACVTGAGLAVGGSEGPREDGTTATTVDGQPWPARATAAFLEPRPTSLFSKLGDIAERAALFKPGWVGPWTFALMAFVLVLLWLGAAWTLTRAPPRAALAAVAVIAFANAAMWSLVTPAFQGPDENVHYAYAEYLGLTGSLPERTAGDRPGTSSDQRAALAAVSHAGVIQYPETRPPWNPADERAWARAAAAPGITTRDGGGLTSASLRGPAFYVFPGLAARAGGGDAFDRLWLMRLVSALFGALTAILVALLMRELLPERRWAAPAAGLLAAFQPMVSFGAGTVNPDAGANLAGAAILYLGVRSLRRGLTPAGAAGILAAFAYAVFAKESMVAFAPVAAFPLLWPLRRRPVLLIGLAVAFAAAARTAIRTGAVSVPPQSPFSGNVGWGQTASWVWQQALPPLPFMDDLYTGPGGVAGWPTYVERVWGAFAWISVPFPQWVFWLCAVGTVAFVLLAARALRAHPERARALAPVIAMFALAVLCVALTAHLSFVPGKATDFVLEQGRYLFPALGAAVALAIAGCIGAGERRAPVLAAAIVGAFALLSAAGQFLVLERFYA